LNTKQSKTLNEEINFFSWIIQSKHYIVENKLRSNWGFYHILQNNICVRS